jgi:hypothetical protein
VKLPPPSERVVTERGSVEVYLLLGGIVLQRARGHASRTMVEAVLRVVRGALEKHDKLVLFDDWFQVTGYDAEVRQILTSHTAKHHGRMKEVHIAIGASRLVAMGVAVASIFLPGLHTYADPQEFERALERATARVT